MRYEGKLYRPPSEADSYILQATIGCSHNACTYCDMYRDKTFRVRDLSATLQDVAMASAAFRGRVHKVFVADGDALAMDLATWTAILEALDRSLGPLKRVSCYATAGNVLEKTDAELHALRQGGLSRLYIGPESGDDVTLKRIAKGASFDDHVVAARRAHDAGMELSVIALLGAGGLERSSEHAHATARLVTEMDPAYFAALTLSVIPSTPQAMLVNTGRFVLPEVPQLLSELRTMLAHAEPTDAVFRTNHASNYLPLRGRIPHDRDALVGLIDRALAGELPLRPEGARGL